MSIDLMSNMLSAIKNASMANKESLEVVHTKQCEEVAKVLKKEGYLEDVKVFKESGNAFKKLRIDIAYNDGVPVINSLTRVSKPGRRIYKGYSELGKYMNGFGLRIVSTNRGVLSDTEARNKKLGGEVICKIY